MARASVPTSKRAPRVTREPEDHRDTLAIMRGTNATRVTDDAATESEWQRAHRVLKRLARERAAADAEQGRWLLAALRSGAHAHLGFGSFHEYIERLFGYGAGTTQEKLRVAEALDQLPETA